MLESLNFAWLHVRRGEKQKKGRRESESGERKAEKGDVQKDTQRERAGLGHKLLPGCKEPQTPSFKTFWGHCLIASSRLATGGPLT